MKQIYSMMFLFASAVAFPQVGVGTTTPKATLDITAKEAGTDGIADLVDSKDGLLVPRVRSLATAGEVNGQVVYLTQVYTDISTNPDTVYKEGFYYWKTNEWNAMDTTLNLDISEGGTLIAVDGEIDIAQEVTVQMANNHTHTGTNVTTPYFIKNMTSEIIDNHDSFTSSSTTNSFTPTENGIYQIQMNVLCEVTYTGTGSFTSHKPVIGLWDNTGGSTGDGAWVARTNPNVLINMHTVVTLISCVPLDKTHTYSFRTGTSSNFDFKIFSESSGDSGSAPVSYYSIKRLR